MLLSAEKMIMELSLEQFSFHIYLHIQINKDTISCHSFLGSHIIIHEFIVTLIILCLD